MNISQIKIVRMFNFKKPTQLPAQLLKDTKDFLLSARPSIKMVEAKNGYLGKVDTVLLSRNGDIRESGSLNINAHGKKYSGVASISDYDIWLKFNPEENGKIIDARKPWYMSWTEAFRRAEKVIDYVKSNIDNPAIVEHSNTDIQSQRLRELNDYIQNSKNNDPWSYWSTT